MGIQYYLCVSNTQERNLRGPPPSPELQPFVCFFGNVNFLGNLVDSSEIKSEEERHREMERSVLPHYLADHLPDHFLTDLATTVFDMDLLLLPRCKNGHFHLLVVDMVNGIIHIVDSLKV